MRGEIFFYKYRAAVAIFMCIFSFLNSIIFLVSGIIFGRLFLRSYFLVKGFIVIFHGGLSV